MKIAIFVILAITLTSTFAVKTKQQQAAINKKIETIQKSRGTWGSILMKLAQLHMLAKGPLEDLIQAIDDTIEDIEKKRQACNEAFDQRTEQHNSETHRLESEISDLEGRIEEVDADLQTLSEQKSSLIESTRIEEIKIKDTNEHLENAAVRRAKEHEAYEDKVLEINEAIETVDYAIETLGQLVQPDAALVQVKTKEAAYENLSKINKRLLKLHFVDSQFVQALVALTSNGFADQGAIGAVMIKFQEVRANLVDQSAELAAKEENSQRAYDADVKDCKETIDMSSDLIASNNENLEINASNTEAAVGQRASFVVDLRDRHTELDAENVSYVEYTEIYEDVIAELAKEGDACKNAREVIVNADFGDYIGDRVNSDQPMATNTAHGQDTAVLNTDV